MSDQILEISGTRCPFKTLTTPHQISSAVLNYNTKVPLRQAPCIPERPCQYYSWTRYFGIASGKGIASRRSAITSGPRGSGSRLIFSYRYRESVDKPSSQEPWRACIRYATRFEDECTPAERTILLPRAKYNTVAQVFCLNTSLAHQRDDAGF